jgi:hypothetical protein
LRFRAVATPVGCRTANWIAIDDEPGIRKSFGHDKNSHWIAFHLGKKTSKSYGPISNYFFRYARHARFASNLCLVRQITVRDLPSK